MPPWTMVLAGTAVAIAVATALAAPELAATPRSEIGATLFPQLPALAIAALAVYGLTVLSLTTTGLVNGVLRAHRNLGRTASGRAIRRRDWSIALAAKEFRPPPAVASEGPEAADDSNTDSAALTAQEARGDIARRHYILLARTHFFSALIMLVGIAGLGAARDLSTLPFQIGPIPTISAILVVTGLLLLAALGRIAIDVAAEPLLERIAKSPAEPVEIELLRRIAASQDAARAAAAREETMSDLPTHFSDQLAAALGQECRPLLDAISDLSENSRALETAMRSSIDAIASQQRSADDRVSALAALPELQAAVEELTSALRRLGAAPDRTAQPAPTAGVPSRQTSHSPGIERELRRLLQEIDAGR
jgi:hypothetical protein